MAALILSWSPCCPSSSNYNISHDFNNFFFKRLLNLMPPSPNEITSAIAIGLCQTLTNGTYRVSGHVPSPKLPHSVQCAMQLLHCGNVTMARIKYCFNKNLASHIHLTPALHSVHLQKIISFGMAWLHLVYNSPQYFSFQISSYTIQQHDHKTT